MISVFAELGGSPIVLAVLQPGITGALGEGMRPPLALGLYVGMGIANSEFGKTVRYALISGGSSSQYVPRLLSLARMTKATIPRSRRHHELGIAMAAIIMIGGLVVIYATLAMSLFHPSISTQ